jgi:YegS/Rv2252/BmrU family lipid kinase
VEAGGSLVTTIAVVAHSRKSLGGGLPELRAVLEREGIGSPLWHEVTKSKQAPDAARAAVADGADVVFVWGGDGMVQRCVDALAGTGVAVAIIPAGTANLLAGNLGIPRDVAAAVDVGLRGRRGRLDVGVLNGERFAVMAGAGFDALMIKRARRRMKDRLGRLAYVWTGARSLRVKPVKMRVKVDGEKWFKGRASCLLVGNVSTISGGLTAFEGARPDDGVLDLGVVTAEGAWQWSRVLTRLAVGQAERSGFVRRTSGTRFDVRLGRRLAYELDGGHRGRADRLKISVEPGAVEVCLPAEDSA